jgi:hypothetical protein
MFEIPDDRHESHAQERTEHDDDNDLCCHESSNGHSTTAQLEHGVNFSLP